MALQAFDRAKALSQNSTEIMERYLRQQRSQPDTIETFEDILALEKEEFVRHVATPAHKSVTAEFQNQEQENVLLTKRNCLQQEKLFLDSTFYIIAIGVGALAVMLAGLPTFEPQPAEVSGKMQELAILLREIMAISQNTVIRY